MNKQGLKFLLAAAGYSLLFVIGLHFYTGEHEQTWFATWGLPALIVLAACGMVRELNRYGEWKEATGRTTEEKVFAEMRKFVKWKEPAPTMKATYYELRETWVRAKKRWPKMKPVVITTLRQPWSEKTCQLLGMVLGFEVFTVALAGLIPRYGLSPRTSTLTVAIPFILLDLLFLMFGLLFWVAGNDDDDDDRKLYDIKPTPPSGHRIMPIKRPVKHGVTQ